VTLSPGAPSFPKRGAQQPETGTRIISRMWNDAEHNPSKGYVVAEMSTSNDDLGFHSAQPTKAIGSNETLFQFPEHQK